MQELCTLVNIHLNQIFNVFSLNLVRIQEIVRQEYAKGSPDERELAPHIFIEFDMENYEVVVKVPSGMNSRGEKFLNTVVGREFGKFGQSPQVSIMRYLV